MSRFPPATPEPDQGKPPSPHQPPAHPSGGYQPPAYHGPAYHDPAYHDPAYQHAGYDRYPPPDSGGYAYDPLVPDPYGGLTPLFDRLRETLNRSGGQLLLIFLLTFALPQLAHGIATSVVMPGPSVSLLSPVELESAGGFSVTPAAALVVMLGAVVTMLVTAIGWGAGIWAVTQAAAGYPADLAAAFTAGVRRLGPMFGWYLLYSLMVAVGAAACLLPGLYLAVAGSLFSFVIVFERERNPFGRSFSLVHRAFGQVLGRVALLGLVTIGASCVVSLCGNLLGGGLGLVGFLMGDIATALLTAPVGVLLLVGLLLTYTQARARQEPVSTAGLWAAANESAGGPVPPGQGYPGQAYPGQGYPGPGPGYYQPGP